MLLTGQPIDRETFHQGTGWALKPEGACRGEVCVPLSSPVDDTVDVEAVAKQLGMPLVRHSDVLASLGPATIGGKVLATAVAPELVLPDLDGKAFDLASLRGKKVVLVAWSPY